VILLAQSDYSHADHAAIAVTSLGQDLTALRVVPAWAAERVGLEAADLAGHSLRAGHATAASRNGASEAAIMRQTGHRSVQMVRRYIREGSLFHDNTGAKLGL
jgi:integrase